METTESENENEETVEEAFIRDKVFVKVEEWLLDQKEWLGSQEYTGTITGESVKAYQFDPGWIPKSQLVELEVLEKGLNHRKHDRGKLSESYYEEHKREIEEEEQEEDGEKLSVSEGVINEKEKCEIALNTTIELIREETPTPRHLRTLLDTVYNFLDTHLPKEEEEKNV